MDVCCCGDFKNRIDEREDKCIAHGIDKDVGDEGGYCFVCEDDGTKRLAEHCKVRISGCGNPVPSI